MLGVELNGQSIAGRIPLPYRARKNQRQAANPNETAQELEGQAQEYVQVQEKEQDRSLLKDRRVRLTTAASLIGVVIVASTVGFVGRTLAPYHPETPSAGFSSFNGVVMPPTSERRLAGVGSGEKAQK